MNSEEGRGGITFLLGEFSTFDILYTDINT